LTEVFARRASGLVREATLTDTALFGIMNSAACVAVWYYIETSSYMFPGVNHIITFILTGILTVFGFSMVWGILGAAMPRSGGSYVYNSRIIHPAIGTAVSFANAGFVMAAWIWVLAPWVADPGIPVLAGALGIPYEAIAWCTEPVGMYIISTIVNLAGLIVVFAGLKKFFYIQRILIGWGLVAAVVTAIMFTINTPSSFVSKWDYLAQQYGALTWTETLARARAEFGIPETWNLISSLGAILPLSAGIYGYVISFIGGEVKSPRRNIFLGNILCTVIMILLTAWNTIALQNIVGWDGLHAIAYIYNEWPEWYGFPFPPDPFNIACMLTDFNVVIGLILGLGFIFCIFMMIPFSYIAFSRGLFIWGMDRIGPSWFAEVHPKYHQPVKSFILLFVIGQLGLLWYVVNPTILALFSVGVMQFISVFAVTALSCAIFPFVKKVRHIWNTSPHKEWKVFGIPYATIAGVLTLIYVGILVWANFYSEGMAALNPIWTPIYVVVWILGLLWYYLWKRKRAKEGIDVDMAFKQLSPE